MADVGRPTVFTEEVIQKLEQVFALGGTDAEACLYANIGQSTLYKYQNENPQFLERKDSLKQTPILKARQTVIKALDNPKDAQWFLERKMPEFKQKSDVTSNGESLGVIVLPPKESKEEIE